MSKSTNEPEITCLICGAAVGSGEQDMMLHAVLEHPMELIKQPAVQKNIIRRAEQLGMMLGEAIKNSFKR